MDKIFVELVAQLLSQERAELKSLLSALVALQIMSIKEESQGLISIRVSIE
jgi:hypothetical protein